MDWRTETDVLAELQSIRQSLESGLGSVERQLLELRTLAEREFLNAYRREQAHSETSCPNVFVIEADTTKSNIATLLSASEPNLLNEIIAKCIRDKVVLQFLCQMPGAWHRTDKGRYIVTKPAKWLYLLAPYVRRLMAVLKHVLPLVEPTLGVVGHGIESRLKYQLKMMEEFAKLDVTMPEECRLEWEWLRGLQVEGEDLRPLRELFKSIDPAFDRLGLKRVITPEGHVLWLCSNHASLYLGA